MFWMTNVILVELWPPAHIDEPRLDVHLSFPCLFCRVTWNVSVLNHCGETRVEKINDQLWDYSVINGIFLNFLPSFTGNEITGWYVLIFLHTLLVNWISARSELALSVWKFGQDRFVLPCQIFLPPIKTVSSTVRQQKMLPVKLWFINVYTYHNPKPTLTLMQIQ